MLSSSYYFQLHNYCTFFVQELSLTQHYDLIISIDNFNDDQYSIKKIDEVLILMGLSLS